MVITNNPMNHGIKNRYATLLSRPFSFRRWAFSSGVLALETFRWDSSEIALMSRPPQGRDAAVAGGAPRVWGGHASSALEVGVHLVHEALRRLGAALPAEQHLGREPQHRVADLAPSGRRGDRGVGQLRLDVGEELLHGLLVLGQL